MKYTLQIINCGTLDTDRDTMKVVQGVVLDTVQAQHRHKAKEEVRKKIMSYQMHHGG